MDGAPATFTREWHAGREVELTSDAEGLTLRIPIERADWELVSEAEVWRAQLHLRFPRDRNDVVLHLETPGGDLERVDQAALRNGALDAFALGPQALMLARTPPEHATLHCRLPPIVPPRAGRVMARDFSGDGVLLPCGASASATLDLPPDSVLAFTTLVEPILSPPGDSGAISVRVRVDGELVHESQESAQEPWLPSWYRVPLPPAGKRAARVSLEIGGMIANVAILDPRIGPSTVGARGARPWGSAAPDIVVFLADTFRADNLATYGGTAAVTPKLDALAAESLCFTRAWSSSSWTLPSHATLFSGFLPFQVDATGETRLLAESLVTVVEMLAHAGYRTAALTDGGFVSGQFGLDQGFGVFSERTRVLADKLAEARRFLEADDGRPVFLFVQTYRTHWPYRTDRQTMAEHGERLGIRGEPEDIVMDALAEAREQDGTRARHLANLTGLDPSPRMLALARQLEAHYLGGVAGLDREFQGFLELLRETAVLDAGYLVFTSDHGEAFLEHGGFFHSQQPFEEQTRIPLLVHGAGVEPRRSDHAVSLLDLAPTLADMAGLQPLGSWNGRSLLDSIPDRPVLSFRARADADDGYVLLEGDRKVMCLREPEWEGERVLAAYDLAADPAEREDLMPAGEAWPHALLQRYAGLIELALDPIVEGASAELDPERAAELKALGY